MHTWRDSASGNVVVAVDEEQKLVLLRTKSNENFRELAVFSWEEGRYCLEDIRDGVELVLHKKDGGIWHLGDEPLEEADVEVSEDQIERLPFQRLAFGMRDWIKSEIIILLMTQSRLNVFTVQAYVGKGTTIDGATFTKRGTPEAVTECEGAEQKLFVNLGPDDVCKVGYLTGMNPWTAMSWRGARLRHHGGSGHQLEQLDVRSAFYTWRFEGEGDIAIVLTRRR